MRLILLIVSICCLSITVSCSKDTPLNDNPCELVVVHNDEDTFLFPISDLQDVKYEQVTNTVFSNFCDVSAAQSAVMMGDTLFSFENGGGAWAIEINSKQKNDVELSIKSEMPHCNVANLRTIKDKRYLYLSEWDGKHRCFVEQLVFNGEEWKGTHVQTLSLGIDDNIRGVGNMDWILDDKNNRIYTQTYKDGTSITASTIVYMVFQIPEISAADISLTENDIIDRCEIPNIQITQDKCCKDGLLYIASGYIGDYQRKVSVLDPNSQFEVVKEYDLQDYNSEPEALFFYKGNIIVGYSDAYYSIQNKDAVFFYFKNGCVLSYPPSEYIIENVNL